MTSTLELDCLACGTTLHYRAGSTSTRCSICEDDRPLPMRFRGIDESRADDDGAPDQHGLLPFLLDEDSARQAITRHQPYVGSLSQRFVPAVVCRAQISCRYEGERGDLKSAGERQSLRLEWSPAEGFTERPFDNEVGYPLSRPSAPEMQGLGPWDWAFTLPFEAALVGTAELASVPGPANERFARYLPDYAGDMLREAKYDMGGDEQRIHEIENRVSEAHYRVVMLPLWAGTLEGGAAVYVNGRTGKVVIEGRATDIAVYEEPLPDIGDDPQMKATLKVVAFISIVVFALLIGLLS